MIAARLEAPRARMHLRIEPRLNGLAAARPALAEAAGYYYGLLHFPVTQWCWCPRSGRANHHDPVAPAHLPGGQADSDPSRQAIQLTGASPSGSAAQPTRPKGDPR